MASARSTEILLGPGLDAGSEGGFGGQRFFAHEKDRRRSLSAASISSRVAASRGFRAGHQAGMYLTRSTAASHSPLRVPALPSRPRARAPSLPFVSGNTRPEGETTTHGLGLAVCSRQTTSGPASAHVTAPPSISIIAKLTTIRVFIRFIIHSFCFPADQCQPPTPHLPGLLGTPIP